MGVDDGKGHNVNGLIGSRSAYARYAFAVRAALLQSVAIGLLVLCSPPIGHRIVTAQEDRQAQELRYPVLDLFGEDTAREELLPKERFLLEIDLPSFLEETRRKEAEQPDKLIPQTTASESELWQIVRQLQQDFEMLKEEIAQFRSELRSILPEASDKDASTKRTVNPFWISDAQIEERKPG